MSEKMREGRKKAVLDTASQRFTVCPTGHHDWDDIVAMWAVPSGMG